MGGAEVADDAAHDLGVADVGLHVVGRVELLDPADHGKVNPSVPTLGGPNIRFQNNGTTIQPYPSPVRDLMVAGHDMLFLGLRGQAEELVALVAQLFLAAQRPVQAFDLAGGVDVGAGFLAREIDAKAHNDLLDKLVAEI